MIDETCTVKSEVSEPCAELVRKMYGTQEKVRQSEVEALHCFEALKSSPDSAANLAARLLQENRKDRYSEECYRVVTVVSGDGWRKSVRAAQDKEAARQQRFEARQAFLTSLDEEVRTRFKQKCGVDARLESANAANLLIERSSSNQALFWTSKDGAGNVVRVLCTGKVVTRFADGGSQTDLPKTRAELDREQSQNGCVNECKRSHPACVPNETVQACRDACEARCR
jgi:hypothetical protein